MPLSACDLMPVRWDANRSLLRFVVTAPILGGKVVYFTDDDWLGARFSNSGQLIQWTVPARGLTPGTVFTLLLSETEKAVSIDCGGSLYYVRGQFMLSHSCIRLWIFQGSLRGDEALPDNFVSAFAAGMGGPHTDSFNLAGTGLKSGNGATFLDKAGTCFAWKRPPALANPITRPVLLRSIQNAANWEVV